MGKCGYGWVIEVEPIIKIILIVLLGVFLTGCLSEKTGYGQSKVPEGLKNITYDNHLSGSYICKYSLTEVFIKGKKWYIIYGGTSYRLFDGQWDYSWSNNDSVDITGKKFTGVKISKSAMTAERKKYGSTATDDVSEFLDKPYTNCKEQPVSDDLFNPPQYINFTEYSPKL